MTQQLKGFIFNLMKIDYPNLTQVSIIRASSKEDAERQIPEGWKIITSKEAED